MASLKTSSGPYVRSPRSTPKIMLELSIVLLLVWLESVIYYFVKTTWQMGLKAILMMIVAIAVTIVVDVLTALMEHKQGAKYGEEIVKKLKYNFSYVTAIIFVLSVPVWCNYYVVIIGAIFATAVKNMFGGFGKNIFNPAVMARIMVGVFFANALGFDVSGLDAVGGATLTSVIDGTTNWITSGTSIIPTGYTLVDILFGNYFGALGETCSVLLLVAGIYLSIRKVINWRTPVFCIGTVYFVSLMTALIMGISAPFEYALVQVCTGGLMFGAVFMLTDPVTGPTSQFGKCFVGMLAGAMLMIIRYSATSTYPEGMVFGIAICNMISPVIDKLCTSKNSIKTNAIKYTSLFGGIAIATAIVVIMAWTANGGPVKKDTSLVNENVVETVVAEESNVELLSYVEGGNK